MKWTHAILSLGGMFYLWPLNLATLHKLIRRPRKKVIVVIKQCVNVAEIQYMKLYLMDCPQSSNIDSRSESIEWLSLILDKAIAISPWAYILNTLTWHCIILSYQVRSSTSRCIRSHDEWWRISGLVVMQTSSTPCWCELAMLAGKHSFPGGMGLLHLP